MAKNDVLKSKPSKNDNDDPLKPINNLTKVQDMKQKQKRARKRGKKPVIKFAPGELKQLVLAALGISLVVGGTVLISPNFPIVMGSLISMINELKKEKVPEYKISRVIKQLAKRNILSVYRIGDDITVEVKDKNNVEIIKYSLKHLLDLKKNQVWNGKWFLLIFDIPEEERIKRTLLRNLIREIGFYQYQQSVYVFPYECEDEVSLLKKIVEGEEYIKYIIADRLENQDALIEYFNL